MKVYLFDYCCEGNIELRIDDEERVAIIECLSCGKVQVAINSNISGLMKKWLFPDKNQKDILGEPN